MKRIVINEAINHFRVNKRFELIEDDSYFEEAEEILEIEDLKNVKELLMGVLREICLLYTSDAADERSSVDLGGRRIIKKTNKKKKTK